MTRERKLDGVRIPTPDLARQDQVRRQQIHDAIDEFVGDLPLGGSRGIAEVSPCAQPDGVSCFYASLGGIARALTYRDANILTISNRARAEGLLHVTERSSGAVTGTEDAQNMQQEFIRREMNLRIRFISPSSDWQGRERISAVTQGLLEGSHVVFGLPRHWVALDGIRKYGSNNAQVSWTGMNPLGARRIGGDSGEQIHPKTVAERIIQGDMPVVIVEGVESRRRFQRAQTDDSTDQGPKRLHRVDTSTPPPRRLKRV